MDKPNYASNQQIKESTTWHQAYQEVFDQGGDKNVIDFQFLLNPV